MRCFSHIFSKSPFAGALKKTGADLFFSKEPHWFYGLFYVFFILITCRHIIRENMSVIHTNPYYSLPLFDFFKIPDPTAAVGLLNGFFSISLSTEVFFSALKIVLIFCLLLSVSGLFFQRFWTACSLVFFFLFQGWFYGFIRSADDPYVYHSANIIFFILLIQLTAPANPLWTTGFWIKRFFLKKRNEVTDPLLSSPLLSSPLLSSPLLSSPLLSSPLLSSPLLSSPLLSSPSLRYYPVYPRLLVILTIGITLFGSFWCKFDTSGFQWINGHTLQAYLLEASFERPLSYGSWLAGQNFHLIWFLNAGVWVFQSTAPGGLLFPKTRLFFGVMGFLFHIGVLLFLGVKFNPFHYYYVVFIPEIYLFFRKMRARRV